jgi:toxin FitB
MALIVVDSSGWIEFFTEGRGASNFAPAINDDENLIVPSIVIFEVTRLLLRLHGEVQAKGAAAQLASVRVEPLDAELASDAAILSIEHHLPMADSIIYATARRFGAALWTQDADFEGLAGVWYFPKVS